MQKKNSLKKRIESCLQKANPNMTNVSWNEEKHLAFDYGMDSLAYQRFFFCLEEEFGIQIEEDMRKSGYFASLSGVKLYLTEVKRIS